MIKRASNIVVVSGFICTGSSALIDALRSNEIFKAILPEVKVFANQSGLYDVIDAFDRGMEEGSVAFRVFSARLLEEGRSHPSKWNIPHRLHYKLRKRHAEQHYQRQEYGRSIPGFQRISRQYLRSVERGLLAINAPDEARTLIERATSEYFQQICESTLAKSSAQYVILNQTIKPGNRTREGLSLIENARVVVVDRDPRDQYIDLLNSGRLDGVIRKWGTVTGDAPRDFARWYKRRRASFYGLDLEDSRVLVVRFEELCLEPYNVLTKVSRFLGIDGDLDFDPGIFRINDARRRVGQWQTYHMPEEMRAIEEIVPQYCATDTSLEPKILV